MAQKSSGEGSHRRGAGGDRARQGPQRGAGRATPESGKTTLVEALLAATGTIGRAGTVADGTTVSDHDPAAVRQQRSVSLACAPLMHDGVKVNLLDTPGYADFVGELRAGLRAADAALFVVSAVDGMDAATAALWEECAAVGMPRAVAVTRLDHPRADFDETRGAVPARSSATTCCRSTCRCSATTASRSVGLLGLITRRVFDYTAGLPAARPRARPGAPAGHRRVPQRADRGDHRRERGRDPHGPLPRRRGDRRPTVLIDDLEKAVARGHFYPVMPVCARDRRRAGRAAGGADQRRSRRRWSTTCRRSPAWTARPAPPLTCDPDGPLVAEVVKTTIDPYVGRVSLVRVFSGTLRPEPTVHVSGHGMAERGHPDHDADERVAHLYSPLGATAARGAVLRGRRHLRDHQVGQRGDRRHASPPRTIRC